MKTTNVNLPSGAVIEMRKLTLREENFIASQARSRRAAQEQTLVDVVSRCTVGFVDPGPYQWAEEGGKVDWNEMLSGDWFGAMIELRKFSYREGAQYEIQVKCPSRACNNRFGWKVDLDNDLFVKTLPEESAEALREGRPLTMEVDGRKVEFNLSFVKDAAAQEKWEKRYPEREMACLFRTRIKSVEGVDGKDILMWLDGLDRNGRESTKFEGLCSDDVDDIKAMFERVDCGVDTEVEVECTRSACREFFTIDLPFDRIFTPARADKQRVARRERAAMREEASEVSERPSEG